MSSFYDIFLKFRSLFTSSNGLSDIDTLIQKVSKMAADLSELIREVDRVSEVQSKAIAEIAGLVSQVQAVTEQLTLKAQEAENSVDIQVINDLVNKLKSSTDSLSGVITSKAPTPETGEGGNV
jgi:methyl-accepting chemotaxis protein